MLKMKMLSRALVAVMLFSFASCEVDDMKDLLDTTINVDLDKEAHVVITEDDPAEYDETLSFDVSEEITDLEIKEYEITEISVEVSNFVGEATKITGLSLSIEGSSISLEIPEVSIALVNNQGPINIPVDEVTLAAIAAQFSNDNKITVNTAGAIDNKPAEFDLRVVIKAKVTGSFLK